MTSVDEVTDPEQLYIFKSADPMIVQVIETLPSGQFLVWLLTDKFKLGRIDLLRWILYTSSTGEHITSRLEATDMVYTPGRPP